MTKDQFVAIAGFECGGVCFLSLAVLLFVPVLVARHFRRTAARGVGVVVGYDVQERDGTATLYHPHVRYTDATGAEHTATARGTDRRPFEVGGQVEVLYHSGSPGRVEVVGLDGYGPMRFFGAVMVVAGVACVLMGAAVWVFRIPVNRG